MDVAVFCFLLSMTVAVPSWKTEMLFFDLLRLRHLVQIAQYGSGNHYLEPTHQRCVGVSKDTLLMNFAYVLLILYETSLCVY